jgi:hypothetical protein
MKMVKMISLMSYVLPQQKVTKNKNNNKKNRLVAAGTCGRCAIFSQ